MNKDKSYWNNKHPKVDQMYSGRPLPNGKAYDIDVRHFIWADDIILKDVIHMYKWDLLEPDEVAHMIQKFVVAHLKYTPDSKLGRSEYWLFPSETFVMGRGDCEDGAILLASMLANALGPKHYDRIRVSAGLVKAGANAETGGHAYCCYRRMSDNEWVVLDWCYYEDSKTNTKDKIKLKDKDEYLDVWFSFNHLFAWSHDKIIVEGRLKK